MIKAFAGSKKNILLALAALGVVAWYFYPQAEGGGDRETPDAPRGPAEGAAEVEAFPHLQFTGPPLFVHGSIYRDGRSAWLAKRFAADRSELPTRAIDEEGWLEVVVRSEAFTLGDWVAKLDEDQKQRRTESESLAVEVTLAFRVPDVEPEKLLWFLVFSPFRQDVGGAPQDRGFEYWFESPKSPPSGLEYVPELSDGRYLSLETWKGGFGAQPTRAYHLHQIYRDDRASGLAWELWKDTGGPDHAHLRFSAGQLAVARDGEGSRVFLRNYYRGQDFSRVFNPFVKTRTKSFYREYRDLIVERAPQWEPDAKARAVIEDWKAAR